MSLKVNAFKPNKQQNCWRERKVKAMMKLPPFPMEAKVMCLRPTRCM